MELSDANLNLGESGVGNWATEVLRKTAGTHAFFSTSSSFRAGIPPGDITVESFYTAIPYRNTVMTADVTGEQVLVDPLRPEAGYAALVPTASYRLGTTNFQALVAGGYKELFSTFANPVNTGKDAHTALIDAIRAAPITAALDGRTGGN